MSCVNLADNGLYFDHNLNDSGPFSLTEQGEVFLSPDGRNFISKFILDYFQKSCNGFTPAEAVRVADYSVYTGAGGQWLMLDYLIHKFRVPELQSHIEELKQTQIYYAQALEKTYSAYYDKPHAKDRFTFHEGMSGTSAILAVHYYRLGDNVKASSFIQHVFSLSSMAIDDASDEILYGRAGYALSLLFLKQRLPSEMLQPALDKTLSAVFKEMIESGRELGGKQCPLFYKWHEKSYLGSAHGLTGILQVLLMCGESLWGSVKKDILKSVERVVKLIEEYHGKLPSSLESKNMKYCQWCHGAPGAVFLLCEAAKHFESQREHFISVAKEASVDVWRRGILQKGPGLCHGVSGNAFVFLSMYRSTHDITYLNRAYRFLESYADVSVQSKMRTPDASVVFPSSKHSLHTANPFHRPFSLYEGIGGIVMLAASLLFPTDSGFPAFEIL